MWISRKDYEALLKRQDDRDFVAVRKEIEQCTSAVRALRTWLQRNLVKLTDDEPAERAKESNGAVPQAVGGWK